MNHPRLGQHFLTSEGALKDIVDAGNIQPSDTILEIGPGKGVLTEKLLEKIDRTHGGQVIAIEKDSSLVTLLSQKFTNAISTKNLHLIEGDVLADLLDNSHDLFSGNPYKIIANIPYYITGEIIRLFLTHTHKPQSMTLLVQKEVAKRIVAAPEHGPLSRGKESVLSLSVKFFGTPRYVSTVKRGSFNPPPRVDSAIIHIDSIAYRAGFDHAGSSFFTLIKAGFSSKRKKVISNLAALYDKQKIAQVFSNLHLDEHTRAEDLILEEWLSIHEQLTATS